MMKKNLWSFAVMAVALATSASASSDLNQWSNQEAQSAAANLLANISPAGVRPGVVVASPSQSDPNYYYYWIRDAALTMDTVITLFTKTSNTDEQIKYLGFLQDYVSVSRVVQLTPNRSGNPGDTGLGEPKFMVDATAFNEDWGRPQNDGPAIRAYVLARFANLILDNQVPGLDSSYVSSRLYSGILPASTVIKADLEFVAHHWQDPSVDLWEEVKGEHFFTLMVQRRALIQGAALADRLGDSGAASFYRLQASLMENTISNHWDAQNQVIHATYNWDTNSSVTKYKGEILDVATILGSLQGDLGDGFFSVNDDRVLASAQKLAAAFQAVYPLNQRNTDASGKALGTPIGRYPEDIYTGYGTAPNGGNPWFLATNAYAELYYRCANSWEKAGKIVVSNANFPLLSSAQSFLRGGVQVGETITSSDGRFASLIQGVRTIGDTYLRRTQFHADPSGHLSEEFNRSTGFMQGARDLTWSYASLLNAVWQRAN
jgi:glucoamylase